MTRYSARIPLARNPVFSIAAFCALASAGCDASVARVSTGVRDSAGVELVMNRRPARTLPRLQVSTEPILSIGTVEGSGATAFTSIGGATRYDDGMLVVLDVMTAELRFFNANGQHLRTVGGHGDGPGEFRAAQTLTRINGDTLAVWDARRRAIELFVLTGDHVARRSIVAQQAFPGVAWASSCVSLPLLSDGALLRCLASEHDAKQAEPPEGIVRRHIQLAAVRPDLSRVDTLGVYGGEYYLLQLGGGAIQDGTHAFLSKSHVAVGLAPNRFYVARNPEYSVEVWDEAGKLARIIRLVPSQREPTSEEARIAWDRALSDVEAHLHSRVRAALRNVRLLPAIHGLAAGHDGELWVKREPPARLSTQGASFDVFDTDGVLVAEVAFPEDLDVMEVGRDYVLAILKDEMDVPRIAVYSLSRHR